MYKKLLSLLLVFSSCFAFSQTAQWMKPVKSDAGTFGCGVVTDSQGNVYTTGTYVGTASIAGFATPYSPSPPGYTDGFISKMDAQGNVLWVKTMNGSVAQDCFNITCDQNGNLYITGGFSDTASIAGQTLAAIGYYDAYVCKLDPSGQLQWIKHFGGANTLNYGNGVATDAVGNIYVTGGVQGPAPTLFGTAAITPAGGSDAFLLKMNAAGNVVWAKQFGGAVGDIGYDVSVDAAGNVYSGGTFSKGQASFGTFTLNCVAEQDGYICKTDASGTVQWVKHLQGSKGGRNVVTSVVADNYGRIYATGKYGTFSDTVALGTDTLHRGAGTFVSRYDAAGTLVWVREFVGNIPGSSGFSEGRDLAVDAFSNVFLCGLFAGTVNFGNYTLTATGSRGDAYVLRMGGVYGDVNWARQLNGTDIAFARSITANIVGEVCVTGDFSTTRSIDNFTVTSIASDNFHNTNSFVLKLGTGVTGIEQLENNVEVIHLYPNPAQDQLTLQLQADENATLRLCDISGKILLSKKASSSTDTLDVSGLATGVYFLEIKTKGQRLTKKIVKE